MDKQIKKKPHAEIRAVFFDIGNVLLAYDVPAALKRFAWAVRSHPVRVARLIWSHRLVESVERGKLPGRKLFETFRNELGYAGAYTEFKRLWCGPFKLNRKSSSLLTRTAARMPVYLLSNTNQLHYDFIRKNYSFPSRVTGAFLSYKLGLRKPEAAIYRAAARGAGVAAKNALFIDDLKVNVEGARKAGWNALHYKGGAALERDLKRLGVLD